MYWLSILPLERITILIIKNIVPDFPNIPCKKTTLIILVKKILLPSNHERVSPVRKSTAVRLLFGIHALLDQEFSIQ